MFFVYLNLLVGHLLVARIDCTSWEGLGGGGDEYFKAYYHAPNLLLFVQCLS